MLLLFVGGITLLYVAVKFLHQKKFIHLITPFEKVDWRRFFYGFIIWFILGASAEVLTYFASSTDIRFQFNPDSFFILLLISIFILPIQTSFEELLIRGYFAQGIAHLTSSRVMVIVISSTFFAIMHGANPEISKYGLITMMIYYFIAGAFLAIITLMDDRLELALGVHFATNFFGATVLTYEGSVLKTDALFITGKIDPLAMIFSFSALAAIAYYIFSTIYKWPSINYLLESIKPHFSQTPDPVTSQLK
jgi:hypothetical protein